MAVYAPSPAIGALRQGEIISDFVEAHLNLDSLRLGQPEQLKFDEKIHPLAIILTQDCDLDWDFKARESTDFEAQQHRANKRIPKVLLCELWRAEQLRGELNLNSALWKRIMQNGDERFHILPSIAKTEDAQVEGFPDLAVDFKRIFAIPTDELYFRLTCGTRRRSFLVPPFLQNLSNRFGYYFMRVALPETPRNP